MVKEIRYRIYADDLMEGGVAVEGTKEKKVATIKHLQTSRSRYTVKWYSNVSELEVANHLNSDPEKLTLAKQRQGGSKQSGGKLLRLPWDRERDVLTVVFKVE